MYHACLRSDNTVVNTKEAGAKASNPGMRSALTPNVHLGG